MAVVTGVVLVPGASSINGQQPDPVTLQQKAAEGERALAAGRYEEAAQAYERLRALSPGTAEIHARLGLIYYQQGRFADAIVPLREALRLEPTLEKIDALLAMSLSEIGQYEEALPAVTKAFAQSGDPVLRRIAGLHLQRIHLALDRPLEALEVAVRLSRLHPDDPEVLYHSGRIGAHFAYLQTMTLARVAPDSVWLHQAAGEANESQGLHDAALREYRLVIAAAPRRPGVRFRVGRVLLERAKHGGAAADLADARKAFEDELALDPSNANAAYELGELHRQAGELEQARTRFAQALSHDASFEHALVGLARALMALRQPADAIPLLRRALEGNPVSEVALYQLAQAYAVAGNTVEHERTLAAFNRLRDAPTRAAAIPPSRPDVTPQWLDVRTPE